jgi:cytochrome P450 / NADPH-cytochrome P450 reductase
MVILSSTGPTSLPTSKPVSLHDLFHGYVELSQPATTQDLRILLDIASSDLTRASLEDLKNHYQENVLSARLSVLDILEKHPKEDIPLPVGVFLRMLPSMRVRQYSISSSPLWNPQHVTLTVSVIESPSLADEKKTFLGVGSNYLSQLLPGDRVQMSVRASHAGFHPPEDPSTPILAYAAGSGLAPLRGFIQERAIQKKSGRSGVGKVLLFFGCRDPEGDYIYKEEMEEWSKLGVLDVRPAFSRVEEKSEGCRYIQEYVPGFFSGVGVLN